MYLAYVEAPRRHGLRGASRCDATGAVQCSKRARILAIAYPTVPFSSPEALPQRSSTHPTGSRSTVVLIGLSSLLLIPIVFFPPGGDAALYYESGQKILHEGAVHYRDIVDVKPPLIYYIYAAAAAVFGSHVTSFRILDYLIQLGIASAIGLVISRYIGRTTGLVAAVIYSVFYTAQSYNGTATTESWVGALAVPMLALQLRRRGVRDAVIIGALAGVLFLLKFSLATPLAAAVLAELLVFNGALRDRLRNCGMMVLGFIAVASLLPLYLLAFDAWSGFAEMNAFLAAYVRHESPSFASTIGEAVTSIPAYFGDEFSLTLCVLTALGVAAGLRSPHIRDHQATDSHRSTHSRDAVLLLRAATLNAVLMMLGVAVEAKYRTFHFSRLIPFASMLAAVGAVAILAQLRRLRPLDRYTRVLLLVLVPAALVLSPLARYVRHTAAAALWALNGPQGFDRAYDTDVLGYGMVEIDSIGRYIRSTRGPSDEVFVSSSVAGLIYAAADERPPTRIFHSAFLMSTYAPESWRSQTARYLIERQPRYIVAHRADSMEEMTGSPLTSALLLPTLPGVAPVMRARYDTVMALRHFELYERRKPPAR